MKTEKRDLVIRLLCLFAGLMDSSSGLLLLFVPVTALNLMQVAIPSGDALVFVRFVGAFVFAVGTLYLFAFASQSRSRGWEFTGSVLVMTAWVRTVVFLFSMTMILGGALSWRWTSVPLTDGLLAAFQFTILARGWLGERG